jgi:putative chitobiose transport system substrate-binding protein
MRQLNKWVRFGILALMGLFLSWLVSCTPSNTVGCKEGALEFWTMQLQPDYTTYFNQLIQDFEAENPNTSVCWVDVPWSAMESKILSAVSAGTAPDVVNLNPDFAAQLASRKAWLNLDEKIPAQVRDRYLPNIWKASTLDGNSFGIPWYLTSRVAIYNQDLLKQAGISQPPQTYAELAEAAQKIKDKTGRHAFFMTVVPTDSGEILESMTQMGVKLVDAKGKAAFNSPEGKAAFQYWTDLYRQKLLPRAALTEGHRHAVELYQSGQTAVLSSSPEFLKTIQTNAPEIAKVSAAAPQITGKTGKKNVAVMNLVIPQDTEQPDMALKFALFVTNPKNQLSFAKAANVLPSTKESLADAYFATIPDGASSVEKARVVSASQMQEAEILIPTMKNIQKLQKILYENLQAAMLEQKTVDGAISDAEQAWNEAAAQ